MRPSIPFDAHAHVKQLAAVGMPEAQAEVRAQAIAELANEPLATKRDLQELDLGLRHDLPLRLGAVAVTAIVVVAALVKPL